jgi:proteasome lid subunit RPN8/RPN11
MQIVSQWAWPTLKFDFFVEKDVLDLFESNKQKHSMKECGGQLFMDVSSAAGLIIIKATPPHSNDRATSSSLLLCPERCREEMKAFNREGLTLVGYWHTHCESVPQLSHQDLKTFQKFSLDNSMQLPYPLAAIVGLSAIRVWSMRENSVLGDIYHVASR